MPLNRNFILILLVFATLLFSNFCIAQNYKSGTLPAIPYGHKIVPPPGMVYVPGGSTLINYDQSTIDSNSIKKISLTSFFIDKTETTNLEYRRFVNWVIDSIAIVKYLKDPGYFLDFKGKDKTDNAKSTGSNTADNNNPVPPSPVMTDTAKPGDSTRMAGGMATSDSNKTVAQSTSMAATTDTSANAIPDTTDYTKKHINWSKVYHDKIWNPKNEENMSKLAPMMDESGNVKKEFYVFDFKFTKVVSSTTHNGKNFVAHQAINVYPDENVWSQDLSNAQTDMYVENYFKSPAFNDYPVVGVNWYQARAFCYWRSLTAEPYYNMPDYMREYRNIFTLPSEAQWVYAAQGFYELVFPEDTTAADTSSTSPIITNDSLATITLPSDSTQTPHDSAWVANVLHKKQMDDSIRAAKKTEIAAQQQQQEEQQKTEVHKHKQPVNPNLYVMDYVKMLYFFNHRYNGYIDTTRPIDSTYIHKDPNGMLMNFKQAEGDYWEDGAGLTTPVMSFAPNEYGVYNMEGNVSEWTMDAYSPSAYSFVSDINPQLLYDADASDADVMKRKVVRGGSFIGNAKSLSPFYRDMELQNVGHCYLGFRCVMQAPEIITKATATRNKTMRGKKTKGKFSGARLPEIH